MFRLPTGLIYTPWESIFARVCTLCGEALFEENEVNHIQNALQQVDRETMALTLRVA